MPKHLSIIITHHKTPEMLYLCIESIKQAIKNIDPASTRGGSSTRGGYEIIVVDSESQKEIKEKGIQVISFKKNLGYSKIVNAGLKKARGEYILIINDDIILLKNAVSQMLKFMEKNPDVGVIGPQLIDFTNNIQISCFSKPSIEAIIARRTFLGKTKWGKKILNKFTIKDWDRKTARQVDWVQGSAIMVRKKAFQKVGLLDERFFMYFEDADWCQRFWQNGYKVIYLPSAKMAHYYHRASKKFNAVLDVFLNKYARTHIISALKYFWKYYAK